MLLPGGLCTPSQSCPSGAQLGAWEVLFVIPRRPTCCAGPSGLRPCLPDLKMTDAEAGILGNNREKNQKTDCKMYCTLRRSVVSYTEARNHFENAKNSTADPILIEIVNGLKHLSHAIEEDIRTLEQEIRSLPNQRVGSSQLTPSRTAIHLSKDE